MFSTYTKGLCFLSALVLCKISFLNSLSFPGMGLYLNNTVFPCLRHTTVLIFPRTLFSLSPSLVAWERKSNFFPWGTLIFICISILKQNLVKFCHVLTHCSKDKRTPLYAPLEISGLWPAEMNWLTWTGSINAISM